eukprot:TRINITY_DN36213_c0_g1_i1.p1 TRINITY_DN36213_c0_g1~~TRINITY_DN36213_c0_g1_i1.p1  ORF type:complete len:829 (+),score=128.16 TRINITY_DN36213_c0_g1_i1:122-2608(+)
MEPHQDIVVIAEAIPCSSCGFDTTCGSFGDETCKCEGDGGLAHACASEAAAASIPPPLATSSLSVANYNTCGLMSSGTTELSPQCFRRLQPSLWSLALRFRRGQPTQRLAWQTVQNQRQPHSQFAALKTWLLMTRRKGLLLALLLLGKAADADSESESTIAAKAVTDRVDHSPVACLCEDGGGDDGVLWHQFRQDTLKIFTSDFANRVFNVRDDVYRWIRQVPCLEIKRRGQAAEPSSCVPGVMLLHVACAQRLLLELRFLEAQEHLVEVVLALPFGEACLVEGDAAVAGSDIAAARGKRRWPLTALDVHTNYIRFYRALSYYFEDPTLVPELLWRPSRDCRSDTECTQGHICIENLCGEAPTDDGTSCAAARARAHGSLLDCPEGGTCTALEAPSGSMCVLALSPLCIVDGSFEAFHPNTECLPGSSLPRMIKACSEMGTTLYGLNWSAGPVEGMSLSQGRVDNPEAFILPVTLRLRSPWHALHSLVPAFAQVAMDSRYGLLGLYERLELILVDQDHDKDRHIWDQVLGQPSTEIGPLDFLLRLLSAVPYKMLADVKDPRCYGRVLWGHELMLYSGGGWVNSSHVAAFTAAGRSLVGGRLELPETFGLGGSGYRSGVSPPNAIRTANTAGTAGAVGARLLLVERRNATAWGRWIDNFDAVIVAAHDVAGRRPDLVGSIYVEDLAEHPMTAQLRLAAAMTMIFGAHGDGLSWAVFMGAGAAILEAVPGRAKGFQVCVEGVDENPSGIFGGLARLAGMTHVCWLNPQSKILAYPTSEEDHWQWNWRQMNIHIDLDKFAQYLALAGARVRAYANWLGDASVAHVRSATTT